MRYYYYGGRSGKEQKQSIHAMHVYDPQITRRNKQKDQDLIIEDDTIYEIDRECIRCRHQAE